MTGRRIRENVWLSAAQTPRPTPITTVSTVATSTCDAVSMAELHSPITPISASIRKVVIAERRPLTTSEISVMPISVTGHGRLDEEVPERHEPVLDDVVADPARDLEQERVRVLDVVEHRLEPCQQPVARRRARVVGTDAEQRARRRSSRSIATAVTSGGDAQSSPQLVGEMALGGIRALGHRLGDAIERHRHHHDHDAREQRERRIGVEAARDDVAEALAADQPGDHDHREREEDRLVHREQQHSARERKPHLREHLARRRAHGLGRLDRVAPATPRMPSAVIRIAGGIA